LKIDLELPVDLPGVLALFFHITVDWRRIPDPVRESAIAIPRAGGIV
jgi:hypothetical protein